MAVFGLCADRQEPTEAHEAPEGARPCYLWPCNVEVWNIWPCVQTQWRVSSGMDGERKTGLDYGGVSAYLVNGLGIPTQRGKKGKWRGTCIGEIWLGLQAMEIAALNAWTELHNQRAGA